MQRFDFVNRANADYIDRLYEQYRRDSRSVDETWRAYFSGFEFGLNHGGSMGQGRAGAPQAAQADQATPDPSRAQTLAPSDGGRGEGTAGPAGGGWDPQLAPFLTEGVGEVAVQPPLTIGVHNLVHSYRDLGHFIGDHDPLGQNNRPTHPLLDLANFNMSPADLDRSVGSGGFLGKTDGTLRDLIEKLRETYCGTFSVEYIDIADKAQRDWLAERMEPICNRHQFSLDERRAILFQLVAAEEFERFLHNRFKGAKRFSLEGAEGVIPLVNAIVDTGAALGVEELCIGMSHRGRLNVLAHVLNKPYEVLLSEFLGTIPHTHAEGDGDVKYHLGYANDRPSANNGTIHLGLSPNPSHLELVNPVVEGIVRSKQSGRKDKERGRVVPLLMHGDAAFTGQGINFETLNLSELPGFRTGGTLHLIVNNQIGFTTPPSQSRFTPYPTDVARMIQAPIFHVNGDDPEACVWAAKLAIGFRQQFKCDVMIDLWCYRKYGHNEVDEPGFTQPVMYKQIQSHSSPAGLYARRLIDSEVLTEQQVEEMRQTARERLESAYTRAQECRPRQRTAVVNNLWKELLSVPGDWSAKTGVAKETLVRIADAAAKIPPSFIPHAKVQRLMSDRAAAVHAGKGIDWGTGEMLAIGSLLLEKKHVRFTGQDVQRGTFSHRHAVIHDQTNGEIYVPLNHLQDHLNQPQAYITILNTMLSELAVLGFEYGYSSADPRNLVIWEAQFGDFVNGAQAIIDQFISASESKWRLMNGMVMLLPHGFEGQGPEHSNAYLERFLSLCAEDNIQVCALTTPAQVFHALRRQIHRNLRKPLVLMQPKSLLRYAASFSTLADFTEGGMQLVIDDPSLPDREQVRRVLFCSGKIYYSLAGARDKAGVKDVALVRIEQLYPWPRKEIQQVLARYRRAQEVAWVQEEPRNRGAWSFIADRLRAMLPDPAVLTYFGRDEAASPATGSHKMHEIEEREIIAHALDLAAADSRAEPVRDNGCDNGCDKDAPLPAARSVGAAASPGGNGVATGGNGAVASPNASAARDEATKEPATAQSKTPVSD